MLPFLVHKIFTFYINGVLNCECPAPGPKGYSVTAVKGHSLTTVYAGIHTNHIPAYVFWEHNVQLWSESSTLPRNLENFGPQRAVLLLTSEGGVVSIRTTNFNTMNIILFPYKVRMPHVLSEPCSKQLSFLHTRLTDWSFKWTRTVLRWATVRRESLHWL